MALIKCPECGQEVSDKAIQCPRCAYPIAELRTDGVVRIKMSIISQTVSQKQKVSVYTNGSVIWEGYSGQIAEIHFDKPTPVKIQYHTNLMTWGAECEGVIDPSKGKRYAIQPLVGLFKVGICLQRVDMIDSE